MLQGSRVDPAKWFRFYLREGEPLHRDAGDLEEFRESIQSVPIESLKFHTVRGDFSRWISDVIGDPSLSAELGALDSKGERLREEISTVVGRAVCESGLGISLSALCPECGTTVEKPRKAWSMTGRPSREGKRTRLTIGIFDCPGCSHIFRRALKKETLL